MQYNPVAAFGNTISGTYTFYSGLPPVEFREPYASLLTSSIPGVIIVLTIVALCLAGMAWSFREMWSARRSDDSMRWQPGFWSPVYWCLLLGMVIVGFVTHPSVWDIGGARYLAAAFFPLVVFVSAAVKRIPRVATLTLAIAWMLLVAAGHAKMLELEDSFDADLDRSVRYTMGRGFEVGFADYSWRTWSQPSRVRIWSSIPRMAGAIGPTRTEPWG
jgi:hypothetical protein